jgi:thiol-disulfide isomerase/thioredoxin
LAVFLRIPALAAIGCSGLFKAFQGGVVERVVSSIEFTVICLCAEWCGTCRDYRAGFESLSDEFPGMRFRWLDIEDEAEDMGDLDVENFPTLLIRRDDQVLFFGTMLPHQGHLRRTLETFRDQSAEESHRYAQSTPERQGWQADADLLRLSADA